MRQSCWFRPRYIKMLLNVLHEHANGKKKVVIVMLLLILLLKLLLLSLLIAVMWRKWL